MRRSLGCSGATSRKLKGDTSLHMRKAVARPRRVSLGLSRFRGKERILGWGLKSRVAARLGHAPPPPPPWAAVTPVGEVEVIPAQPGGGQRVAASAGRLEGQRTGSWSGEDTRGVGCGDVSLQGKRVLVGIIPTSENTRKKN